MTPRRLALVLGVLFLTTVMAGAHLAAQREIDFWTDYKAALDDPSGFAKRRDLVQNNRTLVHGAMTYQIFAIAQAWIANNEEDVQSRLALMEDVGRMYETIHRSKVIELRIQFAKSLDADKSQDLVEANDTYNRLLNLHNTERKTPQLVEQMIGQGTEVIEGFKRAGEDYILGEICEFISRYHRMKEDYLEEAKLLAHARQCLARHRRTEKENEVALRLRQIEQDHDIRLDRTGGEAPTVERKAPKVRREPKAFPPVVLTYKTDKGPGTFDSLATHNTLDHVLWRGIGVEKGKDKAATWPLGDGSVIWWEGGTKLFLDPDNSGKNPVRLKAGAGTQAVMDIPVHYARGTGKYRLLLRMLGETEKLLGEGFNFSSSTRVYLQMARACHMEGKFNGVRFMLVDDNLNGKYDDYGQDLVAFDKQPTQPLSPVMDFGGTLYSVARVKPEGSEVSFQEYVGDTGKIQFKWTGGRGVTPVFLVVVCTRGEFQNCFFNVGSGEPVTVPNGFYQFARGMLAQGQGKKIRLATIATGKSEVFEVEENTTTVKELGAPYDIVCAISQAPEGVQIRGKDVKIYGAMKEHYQHFYPDSYTPVLSVRVAGSGARIVQNKKLGRPDGNDAIRKEGGWDNMWYPTDFEFKGALDQRYEVKVDLDTPLLGKLKGNWNEAEMIVGP
ncbi:MAG: hypothetical protein JXQ29_07060 [Planctomycetes bacterium]|nr:hypothetical protein [Planctomycetota bacterium]